MLEKEMDNLEVVKRDVGGVPDYGVLDKETKMFYPFFHEEQAEIAIQQVKDQGRSMEELGYAGYEDEGE